jgi:dihydropteroate synthase
MRQRAMRDPLVFSTEGAWRVRSRVLAIDHPIVVGILNVTPDSFSDGGRYDTLDTAIARAEAMFAEGADAIDIGGESTRPQGAVAVGDEEERRRVVPVVRELRRRQASAILSVDTNKSAVAQAALDEGADVINDVSGLRLDRRVADVVAAERAGLVLMHSRGSVREMASYAMATYGEDVVGEVVNELGAAVRVALDAGVERRAIVLDPGVGFAKRTDHSLAVLSELPRLLDLGFDVMVGASRKRFVGDIAGEPRPDDRLAGSIGAHVAALARGARIFRVHDVKPHRQALDVAWQALGLGK